MATNKNILLVAVSHGEQLKIQFVAKIYGKVYIFCKNAEFNFSLRKISTELILEVEYLKSQTIRATDLNFLHNLHHMSRAMCHLSTVTCHMFFYKLVEQIGGGSVIIGAYPV